jgi:arsenate reductase-like glutaredoxin family protein
LAGTRENRTAQDKSTLTPQVFGTKKNADTRKALRFFAERRIQIHFVDLQERAASPGELKRFTQKFGVHALLDRESKRFAELGLLHAQLSDEKWLQKMVDDPLLLRQPLVRWDNRLSIGLAEGEWREWSGK